MLELSEANITRLLEADREELLREIGASTGKFAGPTDLVARGREIYENIRSKLRDKICRSPTVFRIWSENQTETKHLVIAAITDCIAGFILGLSPATVAVLLYKDGLPDFCKAEWTAHFDYHPTN
ncbi:hypothetical protein ACIQUG_20610 [Ensifer sp. NPDC090286]|uniref:hypothetical protein n=1 Tax=Ensifer sp. NPDC090286 TaxID=3363991 RepID=UPI00383BA307